MRTVLRCSPSPSRPEPGVRRGCRSQPTDGAAAPSTRAEAWRRCAPRNRRTCTLTCRRAEKFAVRFEDEIIPRLTTPRSGLFPFIGRITSGGGFALGPGYRLLDVAGGGLDQLRRGIAEGLLADRQPADLDAARQRRAFATAYGRYFRFPREDFYGIGLESDRADRTDFDLRQGAVGATLGTADAVVLRRRHRRVLAPAPRAGR